MSRRNTKSKPPNQPKKRFNDYVSQSPRHNQNVSTILALMHPSYSPSQHPKYKEKLEYDRDIERRSEHNKIQKANWRDVNPIKRSQTVTKSLNKLVGGRKRNSTKKKRRNKTKKRAIKNKRK